MTPHDEALREAAQRVWDTVPATYDESDPTVRAHAAALNGLGAALAASEPAPREDVIEIDEDGVPHALGPEAARNLAAMQRQTALPPQVAGLIERGREAVQHARIAWGEDGAIWADFVAELVDALDALARENERLLKERDQARRTVEWWRSEHYSIHPPDLAGLLAELRRHTKGPVVEQLPPRCGPLCRRCRVADALDALVRGNRRLLRERDRARRIAEWWRSEYYLLHPPGQQGMAPLPWESA